MKQSDIDEMKIGVIVNQTIKMMLALKEHRGYTFDRVELVPYPKSYETDEGFAYRVWAKDEKGEKIMAYNDIISVLHCPGELY